MRNATSACIGGLFVAAACSGWSARNAGGASGGGGEAPTAIGAGGDAGTGDAGEGGAGSNDLGQAGAGGEIESVSAGGAPSEALPAVVLNEIACEGGEEWVEVLNLGSSELDATLLATSDALASPERRSPGTGRLAPGDFLRIVLRESFDCDEESAYLFYSDELVDQAPARRSEPGGTWGRLPDGVSGFTATASTPGAPNRVFEDERTPFFDDTSTLVFRLEIPEPSAAALAEQEPEGDSSYVEATFSTLAADGSESVPLRVGVRLKGGIGSFRAFGSGLKSAFKISLDEFEPGAAFAGMRRLTLNNMVQDPSNIHEWLAYRIFRSLGLPAPRVRHVGLEVNGEPWGTYLALEGFDDAYWQLNFDSTLAVYEGGYGLDVGISPPSAFDLDEGSDYAPLLALVRAVKTAPQGMGFMNGLKNHVDWQMVLDFMAIETVIGHGDGYANARNNYLLHADAGGRFRLLPWGTDLAFSYRPPLDSGYADLLSGCLADEPCGRAYRDTLRFAAEAIRDLDLAPSARALGERLHELALDDPRRESPAEEVLDEVEDTLVFLESRTAFVLRELSCAEPEHDEKPEESDSEESAWGDEGGDCTASEP